MVGSVTRCKDDKQTVNNLISLIVSYFSSPSFHVTEITVTVSTRATSREEKNLQSFQEQPCEKWVESSYEVEGAHYYTILGMHIMPPERWRSSRIYFLRRLLVTAHARKVSAVCTNKYETWLLFHFSVSTVLIKCF